MILHPLSLLFMAACYFLPFLSAFVPLLAFVAFGAAFFAAGFASLRSLFIKRKIISAEILIMCGRLPSVVCPTLPHLQISSPLFKKAPLFLGRKERKNLPSSVSLYAYKLFAIPQNVFPAAFFAARARLRSFTLFVLLVLLLVFAINYATFARFRVPACVSVVKLNKCNKKAPFAPCGVVCSRNTQTKNTKHKQRTQKQLAPSLPCAVPCFTVHPLSLNFDYFFSPNRERPCAPSVTRFLWFAVGLCVSRRAPSRLSATGLAFSPLRSLTPRGSLISSHKRAPRVSYTNRFCGLAFAWFVFCFPLFRKVCRLSPFLCARCPFVFRVSFAPLFSLHSLQRFAPVFPCAFRVSPRGEVVSLFVSVSRWFLLCPPCFLFPIFAVSRFCRFFCALRFSIRNASGARVVSIEIRCKITAFL